MVRSAFPGPNREDSVHGPGISRAGPDRSVRRASATPVIGRRAPRPNRNGAGGREGGAGPPRLRRNRPSRCADQRESGSPIGPLLGSLRRRTFPEGIGGKIITKKYEKYSICGNSTSILLLIFVEVGTIFGEIFCGAGSWHTPEGREALILGWSRARKRL